MEKKVTRRRHTHSAHTLRLTPRTMAIVMSAVVLAVVLGVAACVQPLSSRSDTCYVYVGGADSTFAAVCQQIDAIATTPGRVAWRALAVATGYASHQRRGRYAVEPGQSVGSVLRCMRNGTQAPVRLTVPSVRTTERLAAYMGRRLMIDSATIHRALRDTTLCRSYGYDTLTIMCMFVPDTYEFYWNVDTEVLFNSMSSACHRFWRGERTELAQALGLTPVEVVTLASIVDEETNNAAEKPAVAGMYYNRLRAGMPLQADPTVKYALGDFSLRRIYGHMLTVDSPYNTYVNTGLPPGPIRIPTVESVDAVLHLEHHDYLFMCAKEDFSGTHNFAVTYAEHLTNARRYAEALDRRGIR